MPGDLTQARLRELLHYDPLTGLFRWLVSRGKARVGMLAGTPFKGYTRIKVNGRKYFAHRLAWLYVHGVWPSELIDHKNTIKTDNRIDNLRDADQSTNGLNKRQAMAGNPTGLLGATRFRNRFRAVLQIRKVRHHLGLHDTAEAAHEAYLEGKRRLHPGFIEPGTGVEASA